MVFLREIEKEERRRVQASRYDLRSSVGRFSSGQGQEFIASTRGTCGYLEQEISPKIQERKYQEIEVFGFRRLPTRSSTLQEVGILPTLVLVSIFLLIFVLKWWNVLRVCLGINCPKPEILRLGEPEDKNWGVFGPPRRGFARLGTRLRLREGKLRLGKPMTV